MAAWDITAYEYDIPMEKLLHRRLEGHAYAVEVLPCGARVKLCGSGACGRADQGDPARSPIFCTGANDRRHAAGTCR